MSMHRREVLAGGLAGGLAAWAGGAAAQTASQATPQAAPQNAVGGPMVAATGRFQARPLAHPPLPPLGPGFHKLGLAERDAHLFVPPGLDPTKPAPLIIMLHGKSQLANEVMGEWKRAVSRRKVLLMAPQSRDFTWAFDQGPIGPDAVFIDRAMDAIFQRFVVDPKHIGVAGFSDGASYALSTGLVNGDFFSDIFAFSAIRYYAPGSFGNPRVFFTHGTRDPGANFANAKSMAAQLKADGCDVAFYEFNGGHMFDEECVKRSMARFLS
ncbi:alpha/beta hydrolase [Caulobacter sp. 17J80-11]|uniref:alpha/beta hydrolase n=1 Tax=Caulobacter sp. 17J80-11 TaxID=2763502 RepID=UPI001653E73B|nr:PHB depolymerase family esterase [Caulobacter sp. 17J80-11]MBC6982835.1 hypothetical protein [Caulobacter sp. 17J80-11]